ncbi:MAG: hypothetical protein MR420_09690 [Spirochaetia bacterium]|nr:hypothetical protein [Spirochaetia bacterium]
MSKDALSIAWTEMRRRHFATAIKILENRRDIYEDNFEYYLTLGIACLYAGDIGFASSYFQKARNIKLTDTRLLLGQAAIFLRRRDLNRALQYYLEIKENEPGNKIATDAIEFIRTSGDYDRICRWIDTGRIEQFYPPLGPNPDKIAKITGFSVLIVALCVTLIILIPGKPKYTGSRADLTILSLTEDELNSPKEKNLSSQSYNYILSNKEITKKYSDALKYFQEGRDNAALIEINTILNSDATLSIKQKAQVLMGYLEIPDFDTIKDVPSFINVSKNPSIYLDCWVDWGGKISNVNINENGSFTCDLLIGDEDLQHYEGTVNVRFDSKPNIQVNQYVKILGKISKDGNNIYLAGRSVYQSIYK